jgi:pre-mRNA-splicing factor ATP-dependent RNA helicase DHX15/PRP43
VPYLDFSLSRLLEFAANYFDLATFPDGETKRALQRVQNKRAGVSTPVKGNNGDARNPKRQKKNPK